MSLPTLAIHYTVELDYRPPPKEKDRPPLQLRTSEWAETWEDGRKAIDPLAVKFCPVLRRPR
jgi:hypothetical protein